MTLRTSLVITGDTAGAQGAIRDLSKEMDGAGASAQRLGDAERRTEAATESLGAELRQAAAAAAGAVAANDNASRSALQLFAAEQRLEAALAALERAHRQAAAAADNDADAQIRVREAVAGAEARAASAAAALTKLQQGQRGAAAAGDEHFRSLGQQRQGTMMLGQQIQDMGIQLSMGTGLMQVMAMQAGQTAFAIDQMGAKGAAGRVAAFFMTPWGAAMMTAAMVLGPLVAKLWESGEAADEAGKRYADAANTADSFGAAQSLLAKVIDLTTGKLKTQNAVLVETIRLQASAGIAQARKNQQDARKELQGLGRVSDASAAIKYSYDETGMAAARGIAAEQASLKPLNDLRDRFLAGRVDITAARKELEQLGAAGRLAGKDVNEVVLAFTKFGIAANDEKAFQQAIDAIDGKGIASGLKPYKAPGSPKTSPRGSSTVARDEFGRDASDTIAGIVSRYDDTAAPFRQAAGEIRKLDDLIDDLARKKPPNFAALIQSAENAKVTVQNGLIRTVAEAFQKPETMADKAAKAIGQVDARMADLEKRKPPNFEKEIEGWRAAKGAIEDSLVRPYDEYIAAQEEQIAIQRLINAGRMDEAETLRVINGLKKQDVPLDAQKIKNIKETNAELREQQRETERLRQSQQKYLNALGDTRGIITGVIVNPASIAEAPEALFGTFKQLTAEYLFEKMFGNVFEQLQDEITGGGAVQRSAMKTSGALDGVAKAANRAANALRGFSDPEEVLVTGQRQDGGDTKPRTFFERMIGDLLHKGIGIDETAANKIGKLAGKGFEGAMQGQMASSVAGMLGIKQSSTGAAIGGAVGSFLGPAGSIIGGLLGGTLGGLFNKPKYSTASVTSATGDAAIGGSNGELRKAAGGLVDQVQGGLKQIADQLGGSLGAFSLSIGTWDGKYRVNTEATNQKLHYNNFNSSTLHNFDDDAAGAVAFAIADAVRDGAVTGLSAAVQKAIKSSPDIEAALAEALKVGDLELILGGVEAEAIRAFKSFETQAKDRLRIATTYGFDVLEVEKLNAKERLALTNRLMEQQVGSLQRLVTEMTSGSLFEGSSVEQRDKLLTEIDKAKADMDAGVEGAADRLAGLFEQLNAVSREVYGTTGGFASDRSQILDQARTAIARANADIAAAQAKASDPALTQTNAALDENNDQNARMLAKMDEQAARLDQQNEYLRQLSAGNSASLYSLARTS